MTSMYEAVGRAVAQAFNRGLSTRRPGFSSRLVNVGFVVDKMALRHVFPPLLQLPPFTVTSVMLHTQLHITTTVVRRTNGRSLETVKQSSALFQISGSIGQNSMFTLLVPNCACDYVSRCNLRALDVCVFLVRLSHSAVFTIQRHNSLTQLCGYN